MLPAVMSDEPRAGVLANMVHQATIDALAGGRFYERGLAYLREGRVGPVHRRGRRLSAVVRGSDDYRVELWANGASLAFACNCPSAADGAFCKHCVAVALAWLARSAVGSSTQEVNVSTATMDTTPTDIAAVDESVAFVNEVVARARRDPAVRAALIDRLAQLP